jgi:hypothetical protein
MPNVSMDGSLQICDPYPLSMWCRSSESLHQWAYPWNSSFQVNLTNGSDTSSLTVPGKLTSWVDLPWSTAQISSTAVGGKICLIRLRRRRVACSLPPRRRQQLYEQAARQAIVRG